MIEILYKIYELCRIREDINDMGRPDENLCPQNTYILFDTYSNPGQASIIKEFIRVKTDGKLGKIVDHRIDWLSKYPSKFKIKQVSDNYKPNKKSERLSLSEAILRFPDNDNVIIGNKIHELFSKYDIKMILDFNRVISTEKIYINDVFWFDHRSLYIMRYEAAKFFTPFLLNRDPRQEEIVNNRISKGYLDLEIRNMITKEFNEWSKNTSREVELEIGFKCSSIVMHNMVISLSHSPGKGFKISTKFDVKPYDYLDFDDLEKLDNEISDLIDKKIP